MRLPAALTALAAVLLICQPRPAAAISNADYADKVQGAWLGKCIGGAYGMPMEGWRYNDIAAKNPTLDTYLSYFSGAQTGWSGITQVVHLPRDGWREFVVETRAPEFDPADTFVVPIVGMSLEYSTAPGTWELRKLEVVGSTVAIPFDGDAWQTGSAAYWKDGVVRFDFAGERAWLRLKQELARKLSVKPGAALKLRFEARCLAGDDRLGFAYDTRSARPQKGFGPDDDTSYQIVGLVSLEKYGPDLSCKQIGKEWCALLPEISNTLAEGLSLELMRKGIEPPASGEHKIGDAIGGQMKGEIWGLVCPGRPDLAAEYARRDGVVAHRANGVYGEQFVAAMISASFKEPNVRKLIDIGLKHVPADSEYATAVRLAIDLTDRKVDRMEAMRQIVTRWPGICDPVYAEAAIVTLALLHGDGDFAKTIRFAASCGNDTDCNTATVGALVGCILGAKRIPAEWTDPIGDTFRCFVKGYENWKITDLSARIVAAGKKVMKHHGEGLRFSTEL